MKNTKSNNKFYLKKISQIEKVRAKNNKNWMDLLKLSFKQNSSEAKNILREIFKEDKKVNKLIKNLVK